MAKATNNLLGAPDGAADPAVDTPTRAQKRELSRRTILTTAIRLFGERGFEGVRLDEIAQEAGVQRTLVLYYFASKEELWRVAAQQVSRAFNQALHEKTRQARELGEAGGGGGLAAALDAFLSQPDFPRFLVREGGVKGPRLDWLIAQFDYVDVVHGDPAAQNMLSNTIARDLFFAILVSMAALAPLMDTWLSRVAGRSTSGLYPMTPEARTELIEMMNNMMAMLAQTAKAR